MRVNDGTGRGKIVFRWYHGREGRGEIPFRVMVGRANDGPGVGDYS